MIKTEKNEKDDFSQFDIIKSVINVGKKEILATIDTGSNFTVISSDLALKLNIPKYKNDKQLLKMASNVNDFSDGKFIFYLSV